MKAIDEVLGEQEVFRDFTPAQRALIAGCGRNETFADGALIAHEGDDADRFHVLRHGRVALEVNVPGGGPRILQTLVDGDILGFSWLIPPHRWMFGARALGVVRTTSFDGRCLRAKCDADHELGYRLMARFSQIAVARLYATRLQLLDVYGAHGPGAA